MKVLPYIYVDGIPTMRDTDLMVIFDKMVRDDTLKYVFYDGSVTNAVEFVQFIKSVDIQLFVVLDDDNPVACGWLTDFKFCTAQAHFCVFSEAWNRSVEVGKLMIEKAMNSMELKMLVGYVPKFNNLAIDFVNKCGGVVVGELPYGAVRKGRLCPTIIVYYVR